jgi:Spy/CpxP family protein refolding chaperone
MKNRMFKIVLTILFAGVLAFGANAQPRGNGGGRGLGYGKGQICQNIPGLTQEQQDKIADLQKTHWKQMDDLRLKRMRAATLKERDQIGIQMAEARAAHHADLMALLDKDQQQWVNDHMALGIGRGQGRRGGCGMGYGRGQGSGRGGW